MYSHMPDILLDVPDAEPMARTFVVEAGLFPCESMDVHAKSIKSQLFSCKIQ